MKNEWKIADKMEYIINTRCYKMGIKDEHSDPNHYQNQQGEEELTNGVLIRGGEGLYFEIIGFTLRNFQIIHWVVCISKK